MRCEIALILNTWARQGGRYMNHGNRVVTLCKYKKLWWLINWKRSDGTTKTSNVMFLYQQNSIEYLL